MKIIKQSKKSRDQDIENTRKATLNLLKDLEEERMVLAAVKAKDEAILESIGEGIIGTDQEGNVTIINEVAKKMLGLTVEKVIGKNFFEIVIAEDEKGKTILKSKRATLIALKTGKFITKPFIYYVGKNKKKIPVAINVRPIILNRKIIGIVNIFRDITKEKELDKAKDEFISLASHQLKTPAIAISWVLDRLFKGADDPLTEKQKEALGDIYNSNNNMVELITGFLDATKIESSGFAIEKGDVDLPEIVDSVLEEIKKQISDKKIVVVKKYGNNIPHLNIGTKAARIIFQNLITNAIKYTPENGTIEVKIEKIGEKILISIKDNGYGIPEEAKSRIFTKLFRADNIREKEPSGTGLGLYLVKSLVNKLCGKVWFESKEGIGTTFYVNLKIGKV